MKKKVVSSILLSLLLSQNDIQTIDAFSSRIASNDLVIPRLFSTSSSSSSFSSSSSLFSTKSDENTGLLIERATEIARVTTGLAIPLLLSAISSAMMSSETSSKNNNLAVSVGEDDKHMVWWNNYWQDSDTTKITNAERVVAALETLGPTYVKFGQALASRPDIIPQSLADALSMLQDKMKPFDTETAKEIIKSEMVSCIDNQSGNNDSFCLDPDVIQGLLDSLSEMPVAAASVGQVYKGYLDGFGEVAVKVQRPGIRETVKKDAALLRSLAELLESIPSPSTFIKIKQDGQSEEDKETKSSTSTKKRLVNTELVSAVDEFMSRIFEELDYTNEANNAATFARLYSIRDGTELEALPNKEGIIVPEIIPELCSKNVIVMEWIEGTKLVNMELNEENQFDTASIPDDDKLLKENLELIQQALYVTISQLLSTGVMHADPHGGNLLKVKRDNLHGVEDKTHTKENILAYLDFGLLSTVPGTVQDALVCAIAQLVFNKDVEAVANLFGELDLMPKEVLLDPVERAALKESLTETMESVLQYPEGDGLSSSIKTEDTNSNIPVLRFDGLLDGLARLVPRFNFRLPPYFINNARALGTLEGIARSLDPQFNCLQLIYPYAINRIIQNPSESKVVEATLQSLIRDKKGKICRKKIGKLLRDSALFTGFSKRKIFADVARSKRGKRLILRVLFGGASDKLTDIGKRVLDYSGISQAYYLKL